MNIVIGLIVTFGCVLGGYMAMGGHLEVLNQPFELLIIGGAGGVGKRLGPMLAGVLRQIGQGSVYGRAAADRPQDLGAARCRPVAQLRHYGGQQIRRD